MQQEKNKKNRTAILRRILRDNFPFLFVLSAFIVGILTLGTTNYPSNDDWIFSYPIEHFLNYGKIEFCAAGPVAYPLAMVGICVSKIFGFSYASLHAISAISALLAACGIYSLLRELKVQRSFATVAVATFLFNPLTINLSNNFMTEMSAIAASTWYLWAMARYLNCGHAYQLILSSVLLCLTICTRQSLVVLIAPTAAYCLWIALRKLRSCAKDLKRVNPDLEQVNLDPKQAPTDLRQANEDLRQANADLKETNKEQQVNNSRLCFSNTLPRSTQLIASTILLVALPLFCYFWSDKMISTQSFCPQQFARIKYELDAVLLSAVHAPLVFLSKLWAYAAQMTCYLGFFLTPFLFLWLGGTATFFHKNPRNFAILSFLAIVFIGIPFSYFLQSWEAYFPFFRNIINPPFVGTYLLFPRDDLNPERAHRVALTLVAELLAVLTTVGFVASSIIALKTIKKTPSHIESRNGSKHLVPVFLGLSFISIFVFTDIFLMVLRFDRYIMYTVVPAIVFAALFLRQMFFRQTNYRKLCLAAATVAVTTMGIYGFCAAHDVRNFTIARWQTIDYFENQGVNAYKMDAGPEYVLPRNIWLVGLMSPPGNNFDYRRDLRGAFPRYNKRWWPVQSEEYIVSKKELPGFTTLKSFSYWSTLENRERQIFALRKSKN